jgi:hypothetical protein
MTVEREIFINAFPPSMTTEVNSFLGKLNWTTPHKSTECFQINFDGQILNIPYRIYYDEPSQQNLTDNEIFLLDCIFTRHHDGYIREKRLRNILKSDNYLATPFIAQLLGEYVLEILTTINDNLSQTLLDNLIRLTTDNPVFFNTTEQRVQSYWNCYYKWMTPKKADYVGFQILKAIKNRKQELKLTKIQ